MNNFFSIAQKNRVPELEIGISSLADMMRFMIYETNTSVIELNKEIQYIKNYIDVYKLRLSETDVIDLEFSVNGNTDNIRLIPFILIPLVENALKHGIVFKKRSYVEMKLTVVSENLEFYLKNTNHAQSNASIFNSSGVGLKNLKRRLELTYPNKYHFSTSIENEYYITKLSISLL